MKFKSPYLKTELWAEQEESVQVLPNQPRMILADSTGLGKTLSVLATFIKLYEENPNRRLVIFCNKSSLSVWSTDIPKHLQGLDFIVLDSNIEKEPNRVRILSEPAPSITVISYSALAKLKHYIQKIYQAGNSVILVLDEAHYCKNDKSQRVEAVRPFVNLSEFCIACSAMPINNHYLDAWGLFDLLVPGLLGTEAAFKKRYCKYEWIKHSWVKGKKVARKHPYPKFKGYQNEEELKAKITPYILKRVKDYNVQFHVIPVEFTREEDAMYTQSARGILTAEYKEFVGRLPELQLITDNAITSDLELNRVKKLSSKEKVLFKGLIEQVQNDKEAVIVFSAFKKVLDRLQFLIESSRLEFGKLYRLDGETPAGERTRITEEFGPGDILLVSPAGRESLNLQQSHILWSYNLPFSLGDFVQLIGRIARNDSKFTQFDVYMPVVKNSIDEYKVRSLLYKSREFTKIMAGEAAMPTSWHKITRTKLETMRRKLLWRAPDKKARPTAYGKQR